MKRILYVIIIILAINGCSDDPDSRPFILVPVSQDISMGQQVVAEIDANTAEFPILDEIEYAEAYTFLENMRDQILQSDLIKYDTEFDWEIKIINQDVLNAFMCPGGYMYFYTGLMKYLDNEAQLAGVMAHEMAHADRRHFMENYQKLYGASIITSLILGDEPSKIEEIVSQLALGLGSLAFTRENEYEADEYAVRYTSVTEYYPKGIAGFFEQLESGGSSSTPEFLSTHPSPPNRLENIDDIWKDLGSPDGETYEERYTAFKNSLP